MTKQEQIDALAKLLLKLIEEEEVSQPQQPQQPLELPSQIPVQMQRPQQPFDPRLMHTQHLKTINETLSDFKTLGVDINIVQKIMHRVDELYGDRRTGDYNKVYGNLDKRNDGGLGDQLFERYDL
jgi:hypothetical protein